ncbi:hypothetical protein AB7107_06770 [Proteus terrae]|uniref:hypothetical protein n=1 Tax=Proteus terrae TaxID=1574161 RepID=UPI0034E52325
MSNQQLHTRTPTVVVHDNRGSAIREISYCRHPDTVNQTDERITRHHYHVRGYLERSIDARLYEAQQTDSAIQPNIQQTVSLGGAIAVSQGIDNGTSFSLNDIEGTVSQQINAKGTVITYEYSEPSVERYLEQVKEGKLGESRIAVVQKFKWGQGNASELIDTNQVGKCIEHFDTAGKKTYSNYSLQGAVISETQQLHMGSVIDWNSSREVNDIQQAEKFTTQYTYDATGAVLEETDAKGNKRRIAYDIAGFVKQSWLTLKGQSEQVILRSLSYSAAGQKLREEQGNGLVTTYEYEPETQRLLHVKTQRPQGHALGAKIMQDLRYEYDPVGNIICLKNDAEATRYWRNQKIVPENRYIYDSLYQLVSATGRESANQKTPASMQSQTITTMVKDAQSYTNYTRLYIYDRGGNLTQIRHNSAIAQQSFTQDITVSNKNNRALLKSQCSDPKQVDSYFDESGNLTQLLNGDAIIWDSRNHLKATKEIMESGHLSEGDFLRAVPDSGISSKLASGVLKIGDRLGDPAYLSTTSSVSALKTQQFYQMHKQVIIYDIHSAMGTRLQFRPFTSVSMPQREVLLPKNGQYEIINFTSFSGDNHRGEEQYITYIRLKHVPHNSEITTYGMSDGEINKTSNSLASLTHSDGLTRGNRFLRRLSCITKTH